MEILIDKNFEKLWKLPANDILKFAENIIKKSTTLNIKLSTIDLNNKDNFESFLCLLSDDITEITVFHSIISFLQFVSDNNEIRKASYMADIMMTNYQNSLNLNKNLYDKIVEYYKKADSLNYIDDIDKRFLKKAVRTFRKNGIDLNEDNRDLLLKLTHEIAKIEIYLYRIFNSKKQKVIKLSEKDIQGIPKSILVTLHTTNENGKRMYHLELNDNMYLQIMRYL